MNNAKLILIYILLGFSQHSYAAKSYINFSYGVPSLSSDSILFNYGVPGPGSIYSDTDFDSDSSGGGIKVGFGYEFGDSYAVEFSLYSMGTFSSNTVRTYSDLGTDTNIHSVSTTNDSIGIDFANYGYLNISDSLRLFGKVGLLIITSDYTYVENFTSDLSTNYSGAASGNESNNSFEFGFGFKYKVDNKFSWIVDYAQYNGVTRELDLSLISTGINYYF